MTGTPPGRMIALAAAVAVAMMPGLQAQRSARTEHEVMAAYLYNFARFVEWPAGSPRRSADTFQICVLGVDPFGRALDTVVAGEEVAGRKVVARRVRLAEEESCDILFVSGSEERQLTTVLSAAGRMDVLTVSDMPRFTERGGMIQFVTRDGRVRFEIDLRHAQDRGLRVSSDLLKVASAVRPGRGPGK
jgi:hypothetical protein